MESAVSALNSSRTQLWSDRLVTFIAGNASTAMSGGKAGVLSGVLQWRLSSFKFCTTEVIFGSVYIDGC
jgi:hypothetical protein